MAEIHAALEQVEEKFMAKTVNEELEKLIEQMIRNPDGEAVYFGSQEK